MIAEALEITNGGKRIVKIQVREFSIRKNQSKPLFGLELFRELSLIIKILS